MKYIIQFIIVTSILVLGVYYRHREVVLDDVADSDVSLDVVQEKEIGSIEEIDLSHFLLKEDTLWLATPAGFTFMLSKIEVSQLIQQLPELFQDQMMSPQEAWELAWQRKVIGSLADEDYFFIRYYYLMQKRNGEDQFEIRKKLQTMYLMLNDLTLCKTLGGSYHGHEIPQLLSRVEYQIYLLKDALWKLNDPYDMTKQIELHIQSLRQWVRDENNFQDVFTGAEREERERYFQSKIDTLSHCMTNGYYLNLAKEYFEW